MSGWFSKASNVFRRAAPEVEHPFELTCECGMVHQGMRRVRHQRIVCRDCGTSHFVLPRDAYPAPREARARPKPAPEPLPVLAPVEEKPVDLPVERTSTNGTKTAARPKKGKEKPVEKKSAPEFLVLSDRKRFWTPLRFVSLGIAAALVSIAFILVQKQRRDWATRELREAGDSALAAVKSGEWSKARDEFQRAVRAIDILGRETPSARRYRQGLRETNALTGLNSESLSELLASAEKKAGKPEEWQDEFNVRFRGSWVVFESLLKRVETDEGEEEWRVDYPNRVGSEGRKVVIRADLAGFDSLKGIVPEQPVVFAAQLESCTLSKSKKQWDITLRPDSGFLWADPQTYGGLGFVYDEWHPQDEVRARLREQAELIDVEFDNDSATEETP